MSQYLEIAGRLVGPGEPTFIIAELGINHNGDPDLARQMIAVAARKVSVIQRSSKTSLAFMTAVIRGLESNSPGPPAMA